MELKTSILYNIKFILLGIWGLCIDRVYLFLINPLLENNKTFIDFERIMEFFCSPKEVISVVFVAKNNTCCHYNIQWCDFNQILFVHTFITLQYLPESIWIKLSTGDCQKRVQIIRNLTPSGKSWKRQKIQYWKNPPPTNFFLKGDNNIL